MDLVFVLKWVKNVLRCRFYKFNLSVSFPPLSSVIRLGDFLKVIVTIFFTKIAQIFQYNLGYSQNNQFLNKTAVATFGRQSFS